MTDSPRLPGQHAWRDGAGKPMPAEFYRFLRDLAQVVADTTGNTTALTAALARITALEAEAEAEVSISGPASVAVFGNATDGLLLELVNDLSNPAADLFYGTTDGGGSSAAKGWRTAVTTVNDATGTVILNNVETVSTATRDLIQADRDKYLRFTYSGAKTFTVQEDATEEITQDTLVSGRVVGSGNLTIVADGVVVVNPPDGGSLVLPPDTTFTLLRVAEDVWDLFYAPAVAAAGEDVTALSIASGVVNIDCSLGKHFTLALTANVTSITFSNLPAAGKAGEIAVRIKQDGTGSRTVAIPSSFKATGGSDTAVQSAANAYTLLTAITFDQGTRWEYAMQEIAA